MKSVLFCSREKGVYTFPYSGRKQVATMYAMTIKGRSVKDLATVVQRNLTK